MFELDHSLAQEIVDRAMTILPYNVNVMDSQGLILGSGEPKRINNRHEGAQLVLTNERVIEIDEQTARQLKGVEAGINLPLFHDNHLIGVLGISGDPSQLRTYAELVKMTAEMLVAHRYMQTERQWRKQRSEDLITLLLDGSAPLQRLLDEAQQIGLKPYLSRTPFLLEIGERDILVLSEWIASRYPDSWCLARSSSTILWCSPSHVVIEPAHLKQKIESIGVTLRRIGIGVPAKDIEALQRGWRRVADLLAYGQVAVTHKTILLLNDYRLPVLLWSHRDDDIFSELLAPLLRIQSKDSNGHLIQTLLSWCEHYGQAQPCADALGIHRNTLRYRMDRITELSGMDLLRLDNLLELYLGAQLIPVLESG